MAEEPDEGGSSVSVPAAEQNSGWTQAAIDAAAALLADGLHIDPAQEQVAAVLEAALWRKSCHALLEQVDHWSATDPPQGEAEAFAALMAAVPEAAFLAVLAQDTDNAGMLLGRACVSIAQEQHLMQLAGAIESNGLTLDVDALNASLYGLAAATGAQDVEAAGADPLFLLHVLLLGGNDGQQQAAPGIGNILQAMRQAINVECLAAITAHLAGHGNAQGAAAFGLLHASAAAAQSALSGSVSLNWDLPAIDAILAGVDEAEGGLLADPSRLSNAVANNKAVLLTTLAVDAGLPAEARAAYQAYARRSLDALYARLQSLGLPLGDALNMEVRFVWAAAEVETGQARAESRKAAITRLHELLAMAALEPNSMSRLSAMGSVSIVLATAQYETGNFTAAMDQAIVARRLAHAVSDLLDEAFPVGDEAEMLPGLRSASAAILAQAERTGLIARARLMESQADFAAASRIYSEAAQVESDLKLRLRDMLSAFFGAAVKDGAVVDQGFEAAARSAHFAGLAAVNLADAALMDDDQEGALAGYRDGKTNLEQAASLWDQARARLPAGPQASEAARQAQISALRARYCDAKMAFAEAEPLIAADRHLESAQKFMAARIVLQELVQRSAGVEDERNQAILQGSCIYAEARSLFEIDMDSGSDDNLARARQRMVEAEGRFARVGEDRWAAFIRAQSAECEAQILQKKAQTAGADPDREMLLTRASDRRQEAASIYAATGAQGGDGAPRDPEAGPRLMVLPKPQTPIGGAGVGLAASAPARRDDDGRSSMLARAQALRDTIADLERAFERGLIDWARKSQLTLTFRTELNQLEFELNAGENAQ